MVLAAVLSTTRFKGFRRVAACALCLVTLSNMHLAVWAQPPSRAASRPASDSESKTTLFAFLSLESLAKAMRSINHQTALNGQTSKDSPKKTSPGSGTQEQYNALYTALRSLERTRAEYLETLALYIGGVQNHLSAETKRRRQIGRASCRERV